jgi:SAM-dependent methyltransferase
MSPTDPLKLFEADAETAILVDRGAHLIDDAAAAAGLTVRGQWMIDGRLGSGYVHAALLAPPMPAAGHELPKRITTRSASYTRLMDRFYLPDDSGPDVSAALFDIVAGEYDQLTQTEINLATAKLLLEAASTGRNPSPRRVLDFGCGTGVAFAAACRMAPAGAGPELTGTDISPAMLRQAADRGQTVTSFEEWRLLPTESFDAAIAVFVMHYGVPPQDLETITLQMRAGARFAANYFKPRPGAVWALTSVLAGFGLVLERDEPLRNTPGDNRLLVFVKPGGDSR